MSSPYFPSSGQPKPKFNPNAAYEAVQDTPAPKGKKPAFNPNRQYEAVQDNAPVVQQAQPTPQPAFQVQISQPTLRQKQQTAPSWVQGATPNEPISIKREEVMYVPTDKQMEIEKFKGKAQEAHKKIHAELLSNDAQYEKRIREVRRDEYTIESLRNEYKQKGYILPPHDERMILEKEKQRRYDMPVTAEEISDAKTGTVLDEKGARKFLKDINKKEALAESWTVDKYNEIANDPDGVDRIKKVKEVEKEIKAGRVIYDPESGQAFRPVGIIGSAIEAVKQKNQLYADREFLKNTENDSAILSEYKARKKDQQDDPIVIPKGKVSEIIGGLAGTPWQIYAAGALGGLAGPQASIAAATVVGGREMSKLGYASTFWRTLDEMINQGVPEFDAVREARQQANEAAEMDALTGGAMSLVGANMGARALSGVRMSSGFKQAAFNVLKQNGYALGKAGLEAIATGGVGVAGEIYKNKLAQEAGIKRDIDEGTKEVFEQNLITTIALAGAIKLFKGITAPNARRLMHGLSKLPNEQISEMLSEKVANGEITQKAADDTQQRIAEYKNIDSQIPPNVTEEARFKIQDNIGKLNELEQEKETTHKSLQEPIKEKIQKLTDENLALSKEVEKPVKPDTGLTKSQEKEAIETAEEFLAEGVLPDTFEGAIKSDPIGFWRELAQQAQNRDANWNPLKPEDAALSEQAVRDQFGDTVVDYAIELFPAPQTAESSVSVIMPSEIRKPETITIKPQESAVPVETTDAMDVRQQAGDGETMGEGNAQLENAPREEAQIQEGAAAGQEGVDGPPPVTPTAGAVIYAERPKTQLSFRGLQETANEFGFEDVRSRDEKSDLQTRVNAENTANEWASKGEYQRNVDDLLDKIGRRQMVPTDEQRLILEQYIENEKQKAREIVAKSSPEYNRQLEKVRRLKEIGNIARSEAGAALRIPDGGSRAHPINDEVDAMVAKMEANKVDKLTDQQKAEVESQVAEFKKRSEDASAKIAELEAKVAELDAKKEFSKARSTTKRTKKTAEERMAYRRSEIEAAREALRKLRSGESGLSAVPLPGVRELMAVAPHVKNIMVDLIAQGVDNLQDVVTHLHDEFKDVLEGITEKDVHDIIAGKYNEKATPLTELQRQVRDIRDEAKYINQLEALLAGKEPKVERAKVERNRKIKDLKDKIKEYRKEEAESNRFYGESDAGERKLDDLRDELERIQNRRQKEKPEKDSQADKEISVREKELRDQIEKAQAQWDKEKESARQAKIDYERMETERNRQLQKVSGLKEKLENLQRGVKSKGVAKGKKLDTPEIESLKKQVDDAEKELNKTLATEKRIKSLEEELDRLKQRKDKEPKEVEKREITDRERELKEQIDEERKAFKKEQSENDRFYKEELDDDAKKLIAIKKRNQKREQEIKAKITAGQFEKETKKSIFDREDIKKNYPRLRKDALDAIAKKEEAQHEFDLSLFNDEMEQRSRIRKGADYLGKVVHTTKAVMSGIDDSATFVQNGLAMMANPKIGAKVWLEHWKDAFSEPRFKRELAALHADPAFEVMQKSGLDIVEPHNAASEKVEEAFEKNLLAGKIKIDGKEFQPWKYTGGIFERAFTSMGNNMRVSLFKKQMAALLEDKKTFESHPEDYKAAARAINELTGRGQLPAGLAQASPWITPFIWAPRMLTSTINVLGLSDLVLGVAGKGYYQNLTPTQRKFALGQLGRGVALGVGVMGAAALGGATVDYDPRSVTFGDVVMGDHHYNVFGRYTPVIKALVQFALGERVKKDGVQDLDSGKRGAKTRVGVIGGFFRGKMTPAAGAAYDLAEGRNYFTQEPFTAKDLPAALVTPMSVKELIEGWKNDGTWTILNRFLPAFEGLKVSDERDFKKTISTTSSRSRRSSRTKRKTNPHKKY